MSSCGLLQPACLVAHSTRKLWWHPPCLHKFPHRFAQKTFASRLALSVSRSCDSGRVCVCAYELDGRLSGGRERMGIVPDLVEDLEDRAPKRTVAVFWDLDNKPPNMVPPYEAALRLKKLAGKFGEVVDMVAYANQNAFSYVPFRVREERQDRRMLDQLERRGVVKAEQPYICSMCGYKNKTNLGLKKHFKQLHERERNKRMAHLGQLKGRKRSKFLNKVANKEVKYKEAAKTVLLPKVGYGLASDLKRAGVVVRTVEKKPQAADEALLRHMNLYISRGIECICLVSDDSDFLGILEFAKNKRVCTVVVGDTGILGRVADTSFSWEDVASGRAMLTASSKLRRWADEDALRAELLNDDEFDGEEDGASFSESDNRGALEFQRSLKKSGQLSAFVDDEDGYCSDEEDEEDEEDQQGDEGYCGWDRWEDERASA